MFSFSQCNACKPRILLRLGLDECYGVGEVTIHLFNGLRVDVAAEKQRSLKSTISNNDIYRKDQTSELTHLILTDTTHVIDTNRCATNLVRPARCSLIKRIKEDK
jgi:hypothetical protein